MTDQTVKAEQWKDGINIEEANVSDVKDYIQYRLWQYKNENTVDNDLWDYFQDDFQDFNATIFSNFDTRTLKSLINFLCISRVYVHKNNKCSMLA